MVKRIALLALAFSAIVVATPSEASYVIYTNKAAFQSAAGSYQTETFSGQPSPATYGTSTFTTSLGVTVTSTPSFLSTVPASFESLDASYGTIVVGDRASTANDGTTFSAIGNNFALGSDVGLSNGPGFLTATVTTTKDGTFVIPNAVYSNGTSFLSFFGVVTTSPGDYVTSIKYTSPVGSPMNPILDNVTFSAAVPEPASVALLCVGLIGAGIPAFRRRLRRAQA